MKAAKIVYQVFQVKPCFAFDNSGAAVNNATYIVACDDLFLLGILNSEAFWQEISRVCSPIQNGFQLMKDYFVKTLVPIPSKEERETVERLVTHILQAEHDRVRPIEDDLNEYVMSLYVRNAKVEAV